METSLERNPVNSRAVSVKVSSFGRGNSNSLSKRRWVLSLMLQELRLHPPPIVIF